MNTVELREVTKTFGKHVAVDSLSLDVPEGSVYGFIGPNGSGKTTTLRMIMSIFHPDHGDIRVLGTDGAGADTDRIGYLPEERGIYPKMKLREALIFYGDLKNGRDLPREVDRWLERLDLGAWGDKKIDALSKGMSQRAQFIAAVVARPELIILDEPFGGLDPVGLETLKDAVLDLRRGGATVIFSTHDMQVAERMCDYIFMIHKGRKVLDGTLDAIQDRYGQDTVRVRTGGGAGALAGLAGVEKINDYGRLQELRLAPGTDAQAVLAGILARTRVESFELARPSLHDIFVRIARPETEEVGHA
ncbi:MAG: ATP-binding cassette domain-containing protein [Candidatus Krumholzibacteriota bacterium]|nr:ATP-binding cassette domain-containing protein [Candidatus Krumholzibacteriota bacterium]